MEPRPVSGRQEFISDTKTPHSMLLYPKTRRRNFASGDSRTLTVRAEKKSGTTASVQIDTSQSGKRNSFEATATHILPYDTVAKKRTPNKRGSSDILDTSKAEVYRFGTKAGIGKTGVHLRYQNPP